jgi:2,3-bisphosphoglycerate-independent phosphoglycerate mutase
VLANTTMAEANIYKAELENIFNHRFVMIVEHECKSCAIVNDPNSDGNPQWFNVNTSDINWT